MVCMFFDLPWEFKVNFVCRVLYQVLCHFLPLKNNCDENCYECLTNFFFISLNFFYYNLLIKWKKIVFSRNGTICVPQVSVSIQWIVDGLFIHSVFLLCPHVLGTERYNNVFEDTKTVSVVNSTYIPEGQHLMYMGEPVHPWHYNCFSCK